MRKNTLIFGCFLLMILFILYPTTIKANGSLLNFIENIQSTVEINPGDYKAYYSTVDSTNSQICGYVSCDPYFYIDVYIFDELSFYKWKSNERVPTLLSQRNINHISCFSMRVPKPGKYFIVLKSNASLIRQKVHFIFRTPIPPPIANTTNKNKAFRLSKNCFAYEYGDNGWDELMKIVISSTKSKSLQTYLNVPNKVLNISASKPINISIEDLEGITLASYQGLEGSNKINIDKTNSIVNFTTNSTSDVFVRITIE